MGDVTCATSKGRQIVEQYLEYRITEVKTFSDAEAKLNEQSGQGYWLTGNIMHGVQIGQLVGLMIKGN